MLVNQFVFSAQGSVFEQSPAAVWAGSRPPYTNPTGGNRKILFPRFAPEWVGRRLWWAGKKKWKGASVEASEGVLIGEEITPESAHSPAQTPTQTHTYVFLGFGFCCCSLMLRQISSCPPPTTTTTTLTHIHSHPSLPTPHLFAPLALRTRHSQHRHGDANRCSAPRWACPLKAEERAPPQGIVGNLIYDARGVADH